MLIQFPQCLSLFFPSTGAQAVKMLPFLHPWCRPWNNSPPSRESLHFCWGASFHLSFPAPPIGGRGRRSAVCCVCSLCRAHEEEDEESRLGSVTATLRCRAFLLLSFNRLGERGWCTTTSKRFPPIPACLQLISPDRWLLIFPPRRKGQARATFPPLCCLAAGHSGKALLASFSSTHNPCILRSQNSRNYAGPSTLVSKYTQKCAARVRWLKSPYFQEVQWASQGLLQILGRFLDFAIDTGLS